MRVLAAFAHPDDEVLACGGTLARHAAAGDAVSVMWFTDGVGSRYRDRFDVAINGQSDVRRAEARAAAVELGLGWWGLADHRSAWGATYADGQSGVMHGFWFGPPGGAPWLDQRLDDVSQLDLSQFVAEVVRDTEPEVVYTHWAHDLNSDHRAVAAAVLVATRPYQSAVRAVYGCEVPESTDVAYTLRPYEINTLVDITGHMDAKERALRCYASEAREAPHPRSPETMRAHAALRGAICGAQYAEAHVLLREVRR